MPFIAVAALLCSRTEVVDFAGTWVSDVRPYAPGNYSCFGVVVFSEIWGSDSSQAVSMSGSYEKRITFDSEASLLKTER